MSVELTIRVADRDDKTALEDLQRRASLVWEEYREALAAHPDALELPLEHLDSGHTLVAERGKQILGFSVVLPRHDGDAYMGVLFVDPAFLETSQGQTPGARS
jgi:hypothetical protein